MGKYTIPLLILYLFTTIGCRGDTKHGDQSVEAASPPSSEDGDNQLQTTASPHGLAFELLIPSGSRQKATPLFELLPSKRTGVDFQLTLPDIEQNVREVIHLNVQGGICTGDYDGDGLSDFYVTSPRGGNRLYRNLGDFRFRDVTAEVGLADKWLWGTGATFVDIDNDGDLDIYACGYRRANQLYINDKRVDGKIQFTEQARRFGLDFTGASMTMAFADMDNDGDLDGYLATTAVPPPPELQFRVRFEGNRPVVLDSLKEYWSLTYLPGERVHRTEAGQFDHLYRNDGEFFTEVTKDAGIDGPYFTLSATWWDYNNDGFPDLYAANDFLGPDRLYHNNGDGTFSDVSKEMLPHTPWFSMGTDLADVNNDGLIDFLATDMSARSHHREQVMRGNFAKSDWALEFTEPRQYVRNALYLNSGAGRMLEAAYLTGAASTDWTWNPRLADFDNDGRVDLFITNGITRDMMNTDLGAYADSTYVPNSAEWARFWARQPMRKEANVALKNLADLKFQDVGAAWGLDRVGVSFGAATADFDNDGDLDLVVNNADAPLSIYRNLSDTGHRVRIRLNGQSSNRFGIGAKIELLAGGVRQASYVTLARGWLSSVEPVTTLGLGEAAKIEALTVTWPSGHRQYFRNLDADRIYSITEPSGEPAVERRVTRPTNTEPPPDQQVIFVSHDQFTKIENSEEPFNDFTTQPLLPAKLSELGPAWAWADVNGDGALDLFVCGPKNKPGRLYINVGDGAFDLRPVGAFESHSDREAEDTAALFFDADNDGDQDLYVVSGSVEHEARDAAYRDRLYLNSGDGDFTKAPPGALPDLRDSGSVVAASDFDKDGDVDLFVGSRCLPGQYPLAPTSRLLVNAGGTFQDQTPQEIQQAGMVTDAVWADVDGDGWDDLVIATDLGPIRIFANEKGKLIERTSDAGLAKLLGWWRAIGPGDFDHDGDVDFVVTNLGLNSKYRASPERPELLHYGDFDDSGKRQLIEARYEGDSIYPRRDLIVLRSTMIGLMDPFNTFDKFAGASLAEVFTQARLDRAQRLEVNTLESGILVNEGRFRFRFAALPALAQIAPSLEIAVADLNGDSHLDIVLAQNFYGMLPVTGRMNGGVSLLLLGNGRCEFRPVWPNRCGIIVPGDARKVQAIDLNGDGRLDLVFAVRNDRLRAFLNCNQ
jgi:hypothetical protein